MTNKLQIAFEIKVAFWKTTWFIALASLTGAAALIFAASLVTTYFRRKKEKRLQAENKLLEYKLIALKAQINPHFMSNCLSAIQHLIINNRMDQAADYIARFGFLVRKILDYSDRSFISLNEELQLARLYMDLEQLRFENHFKYIIDIHPGMDPEQIQMPALILNPIIENAIWHGLMPLKKTRTGEVMIRVAIHDDIVSVSVTDNGVGRSKEKTRPQRESKGTRLIAERLRNFNLLFGEEQCKIVFDDLRENDQPSGTRVTLTIPMKIARHAAAKDQDHIN